MKALKFIKEAESNAEKAKAAATANIMKQKAEIDARNAEVKSTQSYDINEPKYDMDEYKSLLSRHDWYYDYSDDHSVWTRGSNERKQLNSMQDAIDSDYKIWNEYAPDMYKRVRTAEGESKLPPHLAKLFNPDGTCKDPEMQKRWEEIVRKNNTKKKLQSKWKVTDVTPPGYGPADESYGSSHKKKKVSEDGKNPYVCVHAKKGKYECHADTTYGAAKQAAEHWKLKSTAGIDVHLAVEESKQGYCSDDCCGADVKKEDCKCPPTCKHCDCNAVEEGFSSDAQRKAAFASGYDPKKKKKKNEDISVKEDLNLRHSLEPGTYKHLTNDIIVTINDDDSVSFIQPQEWEIESDQEYLEHVEELLATPSSWTTDLNEGTDLGKLGNGVFLNQFNMGKGVVGLQITSNKNTGYVHLDLDAAKDLQRKLDQWIGMRDAGELPRPGDMDESIENLESLTESQFDEAAGEKDACYHKVKSRYKVWPSAYASGALVQCRKVGAKNWGNKSKK